MTDETPQLSMFDLLIETAPTESPTPGQSGLFEPPPDPVATVSVPEPVEEPVVEPEPTTEPPTLSDSLFEDGEQAQILDDGEVHARLLEWRGMPEFLTEDLTALRQVLVNFASMEDLRAFGELIGQPIRPVSRKTPSVWYPKAEIGHFADKRYRSARPTGPRHPVYIVSKGRAETQLTSRALSRMGVGHYVVVEERERAAYEAAAYAGATVLVLDPRYQREYETCDDLGLTKGPGPGPARNFAWEHAIAAGAPWHWVMDDNIDGFFRLNRNLKTPVADGTILRSMEAFVERYENVAMAGPNYFMFASRKSKAVPHVLNTRIYSCNLIRCDTPYRWRGRYNEDTDLSLRMLKDGWCTVQFNAFLQMKLTTQTLGGGNTAEFYAEEGTKPKSQMLVDLHPDVARLVWKFNRWHHDVDYGPFRRNRLQLREGVSVPAVPDNFGMELEQKDPATGEWAVAGGIGRAL